MRRYRDCRAYISIQKVSRGSERSYMSTNNTTSNRNRDEESFIAVVWVNG